MKPLISLENVSVRYKRHGNIFRRKTYFNALDGICLDVYPGETLGIIGDNGSGKSTLLRILAGIIKPDSGRIHNHGASISLLALQAGFDPNLNGRDNAVFSGMLQGASKKYIEDKINEIHEYSELGDFFFEPVRTYSTGMRARLGFSISTIISPDILMIDEVLSVGDQNFRKKAEKTMHEKIMSQQTVVLVSHSPKQIQSLCNRAILIRNGKNSFSGQPHDVLKTYQKDRKK